MRINSLSTILCAGYHNFLLRPVFSVSEKLPAKTDGTAAPGWPTSSRARRNRMAGSSSTTSVGLKAMASPVVPIIAIRTPADAIMR